MTLSTNRANSVLNYLESNGIPDGRLTHEGFGEDRPLDSNKTKEGRSRNRRVEIHLVKN